jgi:large subunit ribosomal protein L17
MRHLHGHKKLSRPTDQRMALLKNQAKNLIEHGELLTSKAKAKSLARFVQKLVNLARKGDVSSLRQVRKQIDNRDLIKKLTSEIVPKLLSSGGGEVSVIKAGKRRGDGADLAVVTFNLSE